ncbi:MAG: DUF1553 domain-containing protein [Pedosphaera sp.]|nr:DUF1553 domain-containing protein [Pedosphaera sp.]
MSPLPFMAALTVVIATALLFLSSAAHAAGSTEDGDFFEKKIRPILAEHCYECHSATSAKLKGGLRADGRLTLLKGGDSGPAIMPGKPESSLLIAVLSHRHKDIAMPHKKAKLPDAVLADFERWIRDGAVWPGEGSVAPPMKPGGFDLEVRKQRLAWIWENPRRSALPPVTNSAWPSASVDWYILNQLEREGLQPSPPAEPDVWLRRVYFALIGLPPAPGQREAFLNDDAPDARERVVDQLLASPSFGEHWARHWLDLVRYAESRGHESDYIIPNAYEYRDYVVRALNADVRYDTFVREHIAGDLLPEPRRHPQKGFNESILGTGWAFLGEEIHSPVDTRQDENERIDNRIDVLSKTFLGLTVSCARCHDHKFDAISQRDYYALAGYFISSGQRLARFETMENERAVAKQLEDLKTRWVTDLAACLSASHTPVLSELPEYLSAAATAAVDATNITLKAGVRLYPSQFTPSLSALVERLATERSLDSQLLGQWTAALVSARQDPDDLLHPYARMTQPEAGSQLPAAVGAVELGLPEGTRVLVDFGKLPEHEWYADGVGFGLHPGRRGELQLVAPFGTNGPSIRIATRTAARSDPDWRNLDLSPGVEREPSMYGGWKRDGVMLRTPKFELSHGKIHYLVRGSGRLLAAVDSQHLVTGPLHTVLVREWANEDRWHWISQDLSEYEGHRVAIEFSPGNEFNTSIALIVESEKKPDSPKSAGQHLAEVLAERKANTLAAAGRACQELFTTASKSLGIAGVPAGSLEVSHWLLRHPELFSGKTGEWPELVARTIREYLAERDPIVRRIQWNSRTAPAMMEGNGVDEYLLIRGKHQTPKGSVPRRFLEAVTGPEPVVYPHGSGRQQLADALTDPSNPLVARVLVNRVWHHLFGRGIVATVDNFGWLGQRPTHPELLDDLTASFVLEDQWSLKKLLRNLVLSRTYGQSSKPANARAEERDPENVLLHRMNLRRLEGEAIRDAMLSISGRLDERMSGVSVPLHESQVVEARGLRAERGPLDGGGRRSIYIAARRNFLPMMMTAFDTPTPFTTVGRRNVSNVPGQMLFLMNDPFVHEQASVWARHLLAAMPDASTEDRIRHLFQAGFSRVPDAKELDRCRATLREVSLATSGGATGPDPWTELCHALLGVKEFIYVR